MSIARAYADKDTWITEASVTSNFGETPILEIWNNINEVTQRKEYARILIKFSLSSLSADIVNNGRIPDPRTDSGVSAFINLKNVKHSDNQAVNFGLVAFPLTASWMEGRGLDNDNYTNTGFANALSATNTNAWNINNGQTGGSVYIGAASRVYDSNSATQSFLGEEDLRMDVTDYFKSYLNFSTGTSIEDGGSADHGFLIRMTDAYEAKDAPEALSAGQSVSISGTAFYSKKFYSRETNTRKRPYFELEWDGAIKDNRENLLFSKTANLFYYSLIDGELTDLNGTGPFPGHVTLSANGVGMLTSAASGMAVTASRFSKGIYKVHIGSATNAAGYLNLTGVNLGLSSSTSFTDSWTVTTAGEYRTDSFSFDCLLPTSGYGNYVTSNHVVTLPNLSDQYDPTTKARIRVFVKNNQTQWQTLTGTSTALNTAIIKSGTVEIRELVTNDVEVPEQALSYDAEGNFFDLDNTLLYEGLRYKVVLKLNVRGETLVYDYPEKWQFACGDIYDIDYTAGY